LVQLPLILIDLRVIITHYLSSPLHPHSNAIGLAIGERAIFVEEDFCDVVSPIEVDIILF